jgi:hypothetical protein
MPGSERWLLGCNLPLLWRDQSSGAAELDIIPNSVSFVRRRDPGFGEGYDRTRLVPAKESNELCRCRPRHATEVDKSAGF